MMNGNYKTIEVNGKKYILVSDVPAYAKEYFNTPFNIPSYRSIRHYVTNGKIKKPERLGRETYFEIDYILNAIKSIQGDK